MCAISVMMALKCLRMLRNNLVNYHQNVFLQLWMEFNTDEEKYVDDFMK